LWWGGQPKRVPNDYFCLEVMYQMNRYVVRFADDSWSKVIDAFDALDACERFANFIDMRAGQNSILEVKAIDSHNWCKAEVIARKTYSANLISTVK